MKILIFSPFSGIWLHSIPEFYIADKLKQNGSEITYVTCGESFTGICPTFESKRISLNSSEEIKKKACLECSALSKTITKNFKTNFSVSELIKNSDIDIENIVKNSLSEPLNFIFEDIPFGRIVLYDTILHFKKFTTVLENDHEIEYFKATLRNTLRSYFATKKLISEKSYDRIIIYSPQYSINHSVAAYATKNEIPVYFLEAGTNIHYRLKTMRCWKWDSNYLVNPLLKNWKETIRLPFTKEDYQVVTKHFVELLRGKSHMVYSSQQVAKWDFYSIFPRAKNKKVILATMSSFDEAYSAFVAGLFPEKKAVSDVYQNQVEWVMDLIEFANINQDAFIIIRVHPRDLPNKREDKISNQGKKLLEAFKDLPENVQINWPKENTSIYDLYGFCDVLTTGWSITALEAAVLGIQVVTYDQNLPSYPTTLMLSGRSREEYKDNLLKALTLGWSFSQTENSYRWFALNHNYGSVNISSKFETNEINRKPFVLKVTDRLTKMFTGIDGAAFRMSKMRTSAKGLDIINDLIISGKDNLMDVPSNRPSIVNQNSKEDIKNELRMIYNILYSSNTERESKLKENIKRFLNE